MSVSTTYAKALLESLSSDVLNVAESNLNDALQWTSTHPQLRSVLLGAAVNKNEKAKVVEELCKKSGFDKTVTKFLILTAKKGRFSELEGIVKAFSLQRLNAEGGVLGYVSSAEELSDSDLQDLSAAFEKRLGKKTRFEVTLDTNLLAGLRVTVQGVTYDGTLRAQLDRAKNALTSN